MMKLLVNRFFFFKQKTAYEITEGDWSSDVCSSDLLIEDVPGVGKTTLAAALARSIGAGCQRIQFTSDMLPSDILGVSVWQPERSAFVFKAGPVFTNIVLADEINRTTPKTQSSLLEAMNEAQVSLDHSTYPLPRPFMVLATQNRWSTRARTRCRSPSSTASCCASASDIPAPPT